ncbi:hypothetical protein N431DRAFT_149709 [Stipitochalara longipes BDJ]|nr:hypothetical protein N431DRAFT_149709 [Stipitochalara longipes BDJ]
MAIDLSSPGMTPMKSVIENSHSYSLRRERLADEVEVEVKIQNPRSYRGTMEAGLDVKSSYYSSRMTVARKVELECRKHASRRMTIVAEEVEVVLRGTCSFRRTVSRLDIRQTALVGEHKVAAAARNKSEDHCLENGPAGAAGEVRKESVRSVVENGILQLVFVRKDTAVSNISKIGKR